MSERLFSQDCASDTGWAGMQLDSCNATTPQMRCSYLPFRVSAEDEFRDWKGKGPSSMHGLCRFRLFQVVLDLFLVRW